MSSTARATGGVTFRLTPASTIVGVIVGSPSTGCRREVATVSSRMRSRESSMRAFVKLPSAAA
jgi:hypothetical protein